MDGPIEVPAGKSHLVLYQRAGQQIIVGNEDIIITTLEIVPPDHLSKSWRAKLSFIANTDVQIWRRELFDKIKQQGTRNELRRKRDRS